MKIDKLFAALIKEGNNYEILLVNPTVNYYPKILSKTGEFCEDLASSVGKKEFSELKAKSSMTLEKGNSWGFSDFIIWYKLSIFDKNDNIQKVSFSTGKFYEECPFVDLPILNKKGYYIEINV
jgi:hypothetical protein